MKKSIGNRTLLLTHPVLIIGTYNESGIPNMMAASWGGICCSEPPCVAVSVRPSRATYNNIINRKAFTINLPPEQYVKEADFVGVFSGNKMNKFEETGLTAVHSEIVDAPYVKQFQLNLLCNLVHTIELGVHTQFIGEIMNVLVDEDFLNEKNLPDIGKIKPFIYDTASRAYYGIGEIITEAYSAKRK